MAGAAFMNAPLLPIHMVASVHAANKLAVQMDEQEARMEQADLLDVESMQEQGFGISHF